MIYLAYLPILPAYFVNKFAYVRNFLYLCSENWRCKFSTWRCKLTDLAV